MNPRLHWHRLRAVLLIAAIVVSAAAAPVSFSGSSVHIAEASVAQEKDQKEKKPQSSDDDEDHKLNAQVLEIDTLKDPPELVVGSVDGLTVIRVLKTDEIALNGVRIGDYIEAKGEKISEQLFEATELSVSERYSDPVDEGKKKN